MPALNYTAGSAPRLSPNDNDNIQYRGFRGYAAAASTTVTLTVTNATILGDLGYKQNSSGSLTLVLSDLVVYSDLSGALVKVSSGTTEIWATNVGAGSTVIPLRTPLVCEIGDDLVILLTGATAQCSLAATGKPFRSNSN